MSGGIIQIITALSCTVLILFYLMWLKRSFQRRVIGQLLCEFITKEGNGYEKLYPVEHGTVEIPLKDVKKGRQKGKTFLVDRLATYMVDYPANWPGFLQAKAKKAVFFEGSLMPLSIPKEQAKGLLSPEFLYNLKNEMFSELAVAYSRDQKALLEQLEKQPKPSTLYIWLGLILVAIAGLGFYMYSNIGAIQEGIEVLRAAAGV